MNTIQKICIWMGVIVFVVVGLDLLVWQGPMDKDITGKLLRMLAYWVMIALVTLGFVYTFKSEKKRLDSSTKTSPQTDEQRKERRSLRKGFRRLVFVFSLLPVVVAITFIVVSLASDSKHMILAGILITELSHFLRSV